MALVPYPPTSADFLASVTKPETFTGNPTGTPAVPGIPTATIDKVLRQEADRAVAVALSDRSTPPILQIDEGFVAEVIAVTARRLLAFRGWVKGPVDGDAEYVQLAERADMYFMSCGPGAAGKRITPQFIDSRDNRVTDGVRISSWTTPEAALRSFDRRAFPGGGR